MMVADCPAHGPRLIGYSDVRALVNVDAGVMVMHWTCPCGHEHVTATGNVAESDTRKAAAAVGAVRRRLAGELPARRRRAG